MKSNIDAISIHSQPSEASKLTFLLFIRHWHRRKAAREKIKELWWWRNSRVSFASEDAGRRTRADSFEEKKGDLIYCSMDSKGQFARLEFKRFEAERSSHVKNYPCYCLFMRMKYYALAFYRLTLGRFSIFNGIRCSRARRCEESRKMESGCLL